MNIKLWFKKILIISTIIFFIKKIILLYCFFVIFIIINTWWALSNQWEGTTYYPITCSSVGANDIPCHIIYKITANLIFDISYLCVSQGIYFILNKNYLKNIIKLLPYILIGINKFIFKLIIEFIKTENININYMLFKYIPIYDNRMLILLNNKWTYNPKGLSTQILKLRETSNFYKNLNVIIQNNNNLSISSKQNLKNDLNKILDDNTEKNWGISFYLSKFKHIKSNIPHKTYDDILENKKNIGYVTDWKTSMEKIYPETEKAVNKFDGDYKYTTILKIAKFKTEQVTGIKFENALKIWKGALIDGYNESILSPLALKNIYYLDKVLKMIDIILNSYDIEDFIKQEIKKNLLEQINQEAEFLTLKFSYKDPNIDN